MSGISIEELRERLEDLKEYQKKANEIEQKKLQQTIDYYQKLLNQKETSPKPQKPPSLAQLRSQVQEKYIQQTLKVTPPPVPIEIQNQILKNSFKNKETSFSKRPQRLSSSFKDILYVDSDEEYEKPQKPLNFMLFSPTTNNYDYLKPDKWVILYLFIFRDQHIIF